MNRVRGGEQSERTGAGLEEGSRVRGRQHDERTGLR